MLEITESGSTLKRLTNEPTGCGDADVEDGNSLRAACLSGVRRWQRSQKSLALMMLSNSDSSVKQNHAPIRCISRTSTLMCILNILGAGTAPCITPQHQLRRSAPGSIIPAQPQA